MTASTYEYKTVALPQTVQGKRRRGVSEADLVAETLGELIHLEAVDGWEYLRSDILAAASRGGMFSQESKITYYSVLVFRRVQEEVWPVERVEMVPQAVAKGSPIPPRPPVSRAPVAESFVPPAAAKPPEPAKPAIEDPTSPLAQGGFLTTGGQFNANSAGPPIAPRSAPRPPLGSAQD